MTCISQENLFYCLELYKATVSSANIHFRNLIFRPFSNGNLSKLLRALQLIRATILTLICQVLHPNDMVHFTLKMNIIWSIEEKWIT